MLGAYLVHKAPVKLLQLQSANHCGALSDWHAGWQSNMLNRTYNLPRIVSFMCIYVLVEAEI